MCASSENYKISQVDAENTDGVPLATGVPLGLRALRGSSLGRCAVIQVDRGWLDGRLAAALGLWLARRRRVALLPAVATGLVDEADIVDLAVDLRLRAFIEDDQAKADHLATEQAGACSDGTQPLAAWMAAVAFLTGSQALPSKWHPKFCRSHLATPPNSRSTYARDFFVSQIQKIALARTLEIFGISDRNSLIMSTSLQKMLALDNDAGGCSSSRRRLWVPHILCQHTIMSSVAAVLRSAGLAWPVSSVAAPCSAVLIVWCRRSAGLAWPVSSVAAVLASAQHSEARQSAGHESSYSTLAIHSSMASVERNTNGAECTAPCRAC